MFCTPATAPAASTLAGADSLRYRIQPGDNLWTIARAHGTTVNRIKRDNNLSSNGLTVGETLVLQTAGTSADGDTRRVAYTVRSGDSLYTIAQRFNVDVDKIRDWNQLGRYLQPGQQLTLFVR